MLTAALAILRGVEMERVEPAKLLATTKSDARMLADGATLPSRGRGDAGQNEDRERARVKTTATGLRANDCGWRRRSSGSCLPLRSTSVTDKPR